MDPWVLWVIAAVILATGEMLTLGLFLAPFAGGAVVAAVLSAVGAGVLAEWAAFLVVSIVLLAALRPLARAHARNKGKIRMNTAALVGKTATVVDRISHGEGTVKLDGEIWSARPYDEDHVFEPGARVQVLEIRGATALVSE